MKHSRRLIAIGLITAYTTLSASEPMKISGDTLTADIDIAFDKIIMSMDAMSLPRQTTAVENTLDYMSDLFDNGSDNPQILGGNSAALLRSDIPNGDIPINVSEFVMPAKGRISSPFGYRTNFKRPHRGIDIGICTGDTIRAAFPGTITLTRYDKNGYGYYILITHPNGLQTLYAHLDRFLVVPSRCIEAGTPIAIGGESGNSTGPHLHFETRYRAVPINPADIIDLKRSLPHNATFIFNKKH